MHRERSQNPFSERSGSNLRTLLHFREFVFTLSAVFSVGAINKRRGVSVCQSLLQNLFSFAYFMKITASLCGLCNLTVT